tara:strand:+ start:910 stop:1278 length:369 start_codon:yes stop_codon:yes gene_type:complete
MSDLRYIVEDRGFTEEEMIKNISNLVEDINLSSKKVKKNITHFKLQILGTLITFFFGLYYLIPLLFGVASFFSFLSSGYHANKRREGISNYWFSVLKYKEQGVLNKDNLHKIENFVIDPLYD